MDAFEDLQNALNSMAEGITQPEGYISSQIREFANFTSQPMFLEPEVLFAVSDKEDKNLFSECSLFIKRHRSSIGAIRAFFNEKSTFLRLVSEKKKIVNVSYGDLATIEFTSDDRDLILQLERTEQLAKDVLQILGANVPFGRDLVERLNKSAKRKFRKKPPVVEFTSHVSVPNWIQKLKK